MVYNGVMSTKRYQQARQIFLENSGILRTSFARKAGIHYRTLSGMMDAGLVVREARGIYRLADLPPLGNPDLVQVSLRAPKSVICLISSLHYHELSTQLPFRVYIALPQKTKAPRIKYPPLEIVYLSQKPYEAGIEEHTLDGVIVRIYDAEKTVADCFKFRNKIGVDVAIEALKTYLRRPTRNIDLLLSYATIDRVANVTRPYLDALA